MVKKGGDIELGVKKVKLIKVSKMRKGGEY